MKIDIQGKRTYSYPATEIYDCILRLPEIVTSFPVVQSVEKTDVDTFVFTFGLNFGVYSGTYTGKLYISERRENEYLHLKATHKSRLGQIYIDVEVHIKDITPTTNQIFIDGFFDVRGMMRFAGKGVLKAGVSNGLELMFDFLEQHMGSESSKQNMI